MSQVAGTRTKKIIKVFYFRPVVVFSTSLFPTIYLSIYLSFSQCLCVVCVVLYCFVLLLPKTRAWRGSVEQGWRKCLSARERWRLVGGEARTGVILLKSFEALWSRRSKRRFACLSFAILLVTIIYPLTVFFPFFCLGVIVSCFPSLFFCVCVCTYM